MNRSNNWPLVLTLAGLFAFVCVVVVGQVSTQNEKDPANNYEQSPSAENAKGHEQAKKESHFDFRQFFMSNVHRTGWGQYEKYRERSLFSKSPRGYELADQDPRFDYEQFIKDVGAADKLTVGQYHPRSMLVTKQSGVTQAKFPVIDWHTHVVTQTAEECIEIMDRNNVAAVVIQNNANGPYVDYLMENYVEKYPGRFLIGGGPSWENLTSPDFAETAAIELEELHRAGVFDIGETGDHAGRGFGEYFNGVKPNDPRLDPIWAKWAELHFVPHLHIAQPRTFYQRIDARAEWLHDLPRLPLRTALYYHDAWSYDEMVEMTNSMLARHPDTIVVMAHLYNSSSDLGQLSKWMDTYPNMYLDFGIRTAPIGRQPYTARSFFIKYQDRIVYGSDGGLADFKWVRDWRLFETEDEYFPINQEQFDAGAYPVTQWMIYGLHLPDEVLEKLYYKNALKLLEWRAETGNFPMAEAVKKQIKEMLQASMRKS